MADETEKKEKKPKGDGEAKGEAKAKAPKEPKEAKGEGKEPKEAKGEAKAKGGGKGDKGDKGEKKGKKGALEDKPRPPARLWTRYKAEVRPALQKSLGLKNPYQVPTISKIVINMGLGEAISNNKVLDLATEEIQAITGQKAVVTKSKKSISNF